MSINKHNLTLVHKEGRMVDVIRKRCRHKGCKTIPSYNYIQKKKAFYCPVLKLRDYAINVISKTCTHDRECNVFIITTMRQKPYSGFPVIKKSEILGEVLCCFRS